MKRVYLLIEDDSINIQTTVLAVCSNRYYAIKCKKELEDIDTDLNITIKMLELDKILISALKRVWADE